MLTLNLIMTLMPILLHMSMPIMAPILVGPFLGHFWVLLYLGRHSIHAYSSRRGNPRQTKVMIAPKPNLVS